MISISKTRFPPKFPSLDLSPFDDDDESKISKLLESKNWSNGFGLDTESEKKK